MKKIKAVRKVYKDDGSFSTEEIYIISKNTKILGQTVKERVSAGPDEVVYLPKGKKSSKNFILKKCLKSDLI